MRVLPSYRFQLIIQYVKEVTLHSVYFMFSHKPFYHRKSSGASSEPVPTLEPVLSDLTAIETAPGQENWFQIGSDTLLI